MRKLAPLFVLVLVGCASFSGDLTPAQRIFALTSDYNALLAGATAYETQPRCTEELKEAEKPCSSTAAVAIVRKADDAAYLVLRAAQNVIRTPGVSEDAAKLAIVSASEAVGAFQGVLSELGVD